MIVDIKDKIWKLIMDYNTLIGSNSVQAGLDLYGTEQKINMAVNMATLHQLEKLTEAIVEQTKQNVRATRSK